MIDRKRLGLGCMGMNLANRERSIQTIHYALEQGITMLNTGEFYGGGESEMVLREALAGIPRDRYFISVKFGVLPRPGGGIYGLDVNPFHVKAHLAYSLHRLGLDYVDLFQPARMDESIPVEELMAALQECVKEGYVKHIGLTQLSAEQLRRAAKAAPIHTVELDYSVANRTIEANGVWDAAAENHIGILAFGVLAHGRFSGLPHGFLEDGGHGTAPCLPLVELAKEKGTSPEKLAQAYVYAKSPDIRVLVGTTRQEHLREAIDALSLELTEEDIRRLEAAFPAGAMQGFGMPDFRFRNGKVVQE